MTEWRVCAGHPRYEISEAGDLRSRFRSRTRFAGHIVKGRVHGGYRQYHIPTETKKVNVWAHRLVLETFIGPAPSPKHVCAHGDGDRLNNHWSNLRWATQTENHGDRRAHGTNPAGERNGRAILTDRDVARIRACLTGQRGEILKLSREYGISDSAMGAVVRGIHWRHVG